MKGAAGGRSERPALAMYIYERATGSFGYVCQSSAPELATLPELWRRTWRQIEPSRAHRTTRTTGVARAGPREPHQRGAAPGWRPRHGPELRRYAGPTGWAALSKRQGATWPARQRKRAEDGQHARLQAIFTQLS